MTSCLPSIGRTYSAGEYNKRIIGFGQNIVPQVAQALAHFTCSRRVALSEMGLALGSVPCVGND